MKNASKQKKELKWYKPVLASYWKNTSTQQGLKGSLSVYAMLGLKWIKNHIETLLV
jgi:hypothetical protein